MSAQIEILRTSENQAILLPHLRSLCGIVLNGILHRAAFQDRLLLHCFADGHMKRLPKDGKRNAGKLRFPRFEAALLCDGLSGLKAEKRHDVKGAKVAKERSMGSERGNFENILSA